jgi:hypothetical protein
MNRHAVRGVRQMKQIEMVKKTVFVPMTREIKLGQIQTRIEGQESTQAVMCIHQSTKTPSRNASHISLPSHKISLLASGKPHFFEAAEC